jgi:hypothetical protein
LGELSQIPKACQQQVAGPGLHLSLHVTRELLDAREPLTGALAVLVRADALAKPRSGQTQPGPLLMGERTRLVTGTGAQTLQIVVVSAPRSRRSYRCHPCQDASQATRGAEQSVTGTLRVAQCSCLNTRRLTSIRGTSSDDVDGVFVTQRWPRTGASGSGALHGVAVCERPGVHQCTWVPRGRVAPPVPRYCCVRTTTTTR